MKLKVRVERVHPVDGMGFRIRLRERDTELGHGVSVSGRLVRYGMHATGETGTQRFDGTLHREHATAAQGEERAAGVIHASHHADLLLRQATLARWCATVMGFPRHPERRGAGVVALERLTEVRLVQLDLRAAHFRRLRQSTKHSMNRNHMAGLSFEEATTLLVLALNVRPQSTHSQRWEPSLPYPFLLMWTEPQRTHASGFSGSPTAFTNEPSYSTPRRALMASSRSPSLNAHISSRTLFAIDATLNFLITPL